MNTKSSVLKKTVYVLIPLALVAAMVIRLKSNKEITLQKVYQYDIEKPIPVLADTIQIENLDADLFFSGTFEPNKETKISAEVQGKINDVLVDIGSNVTQGQALIQLDNSLLKFQLQTTELQIEGLEADVNRYSVLTKADAIQGVQLEKAELALKSAKVQRATLLEQINKTLIKAPFKGIVTSKLTEAGAFAAPGVPLLQITDISNLKFTANVSENELKLFVVNQSYQVTTDAYSEIVLNGVTTMIGSKANAGSSFPIQFTVSNTPDMKIKSGMFGKVNLKTITSEKGIVISSSTITGPANQPQVYLIKNGKAMVQNITILSRTQNKAIVSGGLKAGDVMITNGFINLFNGANVTVK